MFDTDKWQEIYYSLKQNKLRSFLTAFGVFWGIFMLIVMLGSGNGLQNGVTQGFGDFATNSVFIWTQRTTVEYKGFPKGRFFNYNNADITAIQKNIKNIRYLAPRLRAGGFGGGDNVIRGLNSGAFQISGDYPAMNLIDPINIDKGRFINDIDIEQKRKIVIIGTRVQEALFEPDEDPMGEYIRIQGVYFKVAGIFSSKKSGEQGDRENQGIYMPFTTLQKTYNYGDIVGFFAITAYDNVSVSKVEEETIKLLKQRHLIAPEDDQAIGHFNVEKEFKQMKGVFLGIDGLIWLVGIGTLLAGVIGVSNIMLVIVKERTKEIGIQRAIGATPVKIMSQIITESIFITAFAGYIGLVIGTGLIELVSFALIKFEVDSNMFRNPEVDFQVAVTALLILVISGAFAGFIPAKRAVSIKPIDALRSE
ncbi:MAG: ABC transporter permease [Bacteroidales bacterium]|nr:ABC transporter permease [Bacteroidales bacterium]